MKKNQCQTCGAIHFDLNETVAVNEDDLKNSIIISDDQSIEKEKMIEERLICARCGSFIFKTPDVFRCKGCNYFVSIKDSFCPKCGRVFWGTFLFLSAIGCFFIYLDLITLIEILKNGFTLNSVLGILICSSFVILILNQLRKDYRDKEKSNKNN